MIGFSAPEEKAVRAVLTGKNQKKGAKIFYAFACSLTATLIYGIFTSLINAFWTPEELFTDYLFVGLTCHTIFLLGVGFWVIYKPIRSKTLDANGHYRTVLEKDCIKVLFPDEPEVIVNLSDVDNVVEYDIFYLISCYGGTDEIVCSKSAFEKGNHEKLVKYFEQANIPFSVYQKKIYRSVFKKVSKKVRLGVVSIILSLLAVLVAYPFFWLASNVLIPFVPNLLSKLLASIWDLYLIVRVLVGLLFVPIGVVATIISGISGLFVILCPFFFIVIAFRCSLKQINRNGNWIGYVAIILVFLATIVAIFLGLMALEIFAF